MAGEAAPIKVPYLKSPAQAREAILLAAQLHREQAAVAGGAAAAPAPAAMQRGQGGTLEARLAALEELVGKGALTQVRLQERSMRTAGLQGLGSGCEPGCSNTEKSLRHSRQLMPCFTAAACCRRRWRQCGRGCWRPART